MNKTQLKNFAIWARRKLIADIELKASLIGISKDGIQQASDASTSDLQVFEINGNITKLSGKDIQKRKIIVDKIRQKEEDTDYITAFNYIVEEVAYTWFNRLIAIRYMEVNDYLPSRIRVLSSSYNTEPEILKNYLDADLNLDEKDIEKIERYNEEHKPDELFALLFTKQCNALNEILPELFDNSLDYMEILLRIDFTSKESVIYKLVNEVDEENFEDVEVVGWLYQYYNTEKKEQIDADVKKNIKITKETLPIKTQLFTPDWIVKYMVENSLGRLWLEKEENEDLKKSWKYYIEEAEQDEEVKEQLEEIRKGYKNLDIEEIKIIDPCMGSGHILTYTFDVLMQIYESKGYSTREAVKSIIENNIYGIELSKRAYQLAYFAIMMKARQYDSRIFRRELKTNLCYTEEKSEIKFVEKFGSEEIVQCVRDLEDSDLLGSLVETDATDYENLIDTIENFNIIDLGVEYSNAPEKRIAILKNQIRLHELLSQKYDVVITNPPYLGSKAMCGKLKKYLEKKYPNSKSDLFAVFIERCLKLSQNNKYIAMITQSSWTYSDTFKNLRNFILNFFNILNLLELGGNTFEEIKGQVVQSTSFIIRNKNEILYKPEIIKLNSKNLSFEKELEFLSNNFNFSNEISQKMYLSIPDSVFLYNLKSYINLYDNKSLIQDIFEVKRGPSLPSIDYLKNWYEVNINDIGKNTENKKWAFCTRSGEKTKWYQPIYEIIRVDILDKISNYNSQFQEGIVWPDAKFGGKKIASRLKEKFICYESGVNLIITNNKYYQNLLLAFFNLFIYEELLESIVNGQHFSPIYIRKLPFFDIKSNVIDNEVENILNLKKNIESYNELDVNFKGVYFFENKIIESCYNKQYEIYNDFYNSIEISEMKIKKEFFNNLDIEEFESKVEYINDLNKMKYIKSFISYAVGCMLGRYSLDVDGLVFAGGEWDDSKYTTFKPIDKNCLLILEEEIPELKQYDIVNKFEEFVEVVFGRDTLKENLQFIADALEIKGKDEYDIIRTYFVKEFYKEHTQMYKKCPIYWLFDAGKQNSFKALMYLHRYNTDTVGMINVEFLQKVQEAYERFKAIEEKAKIIEKYDKKLIELKPYLEKIAHISNIRIDLDLDDGVKVNYKKLQTGKDGNNLEILAKIK